MTSPTCTAVGCYNPVRRKTGTIVPKCGDRIVDGLRWGWFCSQRCAGLTTGQKNYHLEAFKVSVRTRRERRIRSEIHRVKVLCEGVMDNEERVSLVDAVKILMREKVREYNRGYKAGQYIGRRRAA